MKIFVAHYSKLTERKEHVLEQFRKHNITNYEFVENFDKEHLTKEETKYFQPNLKLSEISLFLKHIYIYREILEKYEEALILEDDIILCDDFMCLVTHYRSLFPDDYDIVYLGNGCNLHVPPQHIQHSKHIYEMTNKYSKCTDSYMIQKKACVQLLHYFKCGIKMPIDWWLTEASTQQDLSIFWVEPTLVSQGSQTNLFVSSIR